MGRRQLCLSGALGLAQGSQLGWGDVADAAEAAIVGRKTGIGIARPFALTSCRAALVGAGFPTAAADDALHIFARIGRARRIVDRAFLVVRRTINVLTPFRHIAVEIANPVAVRLLLTHDMSF